MKLLLFSIVVLYVLAMATAETAETETISDMKATVAKLLTTIQGMQFTQDKGFLPPFHWQEIKGFTPGHTFMNFKGGIGARTCRRDLTMLDNNAALGSALLSTSLEVVEMGLATPNQGLITDALNGILACHDSNYPGKMPIYAFWPMKYNSQLHLYYQAPPNIFQITKTFGSFSQGAEKFFDTIPVLGPAIYKKYFAKFLHSPQAPSVTIPSDFDTSMYALVLGSRLKQTFPSLFSKWLNTSSDLAGLANYMDMYAYKPFSTKANESSIDPRTYYWLRPYLLKKQADAKARGMKASVSLATTWVTNLGRNNQLFPWISMPYNVNNVEIGVLADVVYGLSLAIVNKITSSTSWFNTKVQQIYLNSAEVVAFGMDSGVHFNRVDLTALYYPYELYMPWFAAKARFTLTKSPKNQFAVMDKVRGILETSLRGSCWNYITKKAVTSGTQAYWDGWLGMGDDHPSPDDRLFVTGIALGTIVDIWSVGNYRNGTKCVYKWDPKAPQAAKDLATKAANFLQAEIFGNKYRKDNCATDEDAKTPYLIPHTFPANVNVRVNGSKVNPSTSPSTMLGDIDLVSAVQGIIDEKTYQALLKQPRFGIPFSQTAYLGMNAEPFACWNIPAATYLVTMIGMAKYVAAMTC